MEKLKNFLQEKTTEVLEEALENMAFVGIEECSQETIAELDQDTLAVNLLITEPALLEMRLDIAKELLYQIAETMYTMERDELEDQHINDLLSEILNTIAGRFMSEILPAESNFALGLPELTNEESILSDLQFYYLAEDCPLTVTIKAADIDNLKTLLSNSI